ncbi:hypothetical protein M758_11G029700 [Ceratodon purpureus]|nr:hypothetical protein M758_11G029700 [Ceratodon purpureus]
MNCKHSCLITSTNAASNSSSVNKAPPVTSSDGVNSKTIYALRFLLRTVLTALIKLRRSKVFNALLISGCCRFVLASRSAVHIPARRNKSYNLL